LALQKLSVPPERLAPLKLTGLPENLALRKLTSPLKKKASQNLTGLRENLAPLRAAVNPVSTAGTRWWCHSDLRRLLTGHRPAASQRQFIHRAPGRRGPAAGPAPSPEVMRARAAAIDELLRASGKPARRVQ
jgi:hypothetical protein